MGILYMSVFVFRMGGAQNFNNNIVLNLFYSFIAFPVTILFVSYDTVDAVVLISCVF